MESYIDKLKKNIIETQNLELFDSAEKEKYAVNNPCVICCVTMGKEPHIGHLFLMTIAEQMRVGLESQSQLILINNNTGPRSAGALIKVATDYNLSLEEAVNVMDNKQLSVAQVVTSYRARIDEKKAIEKASGLLLESGRDIFSVISDETEKVLNKSGYEVLVLSESELLKRSSERIDSLNLDWRGTGFSPIVVDKRVILLEKSGTLTATGALLSSASTVVEMFNSDLVVIVDSSMDVGDVTFVQSKAIPGVYGAQVMGSGVGFDGKIASGTKGEATTIKEISEQFYEIRPHGDLKKATIFFTLTNPLYFPGGSKSLKDSFYNFRNNSHILEEIVSSSDRLLVFNEEILSSMDNLSRRISSKSLGGNESVNKFLEYLGQKSAVLLAGEKMRVMSESKKVVNGVRQNYYFNQLNTILKNIEGVRSLTEEQFLTIGKMLQFCLERLGI